MSIFNILRPRQNGRHFADDIFKCIFLKENIWISNKISLKFVPKVRINNIPVLGQIMAWRRSGDKPLSEPMMVDLLTHICVTRPQWVNRIYRCSQCWMSHWREWSALIVMALSARADDYVNSLEGNAMYDAVNAEVQTHMIPRAIRRQTSALFASLALCAGNLPVTGEFPSQWPVKRSFDVFFDRRLNKRRLSKQLRCRWFETQSRPSWRHSNDSMSHYTEWSAQSPWHCLSDPKTAWRVRMEMWCIMPIVRYGQTCMIPRATRR